MKKVPVSVDREGERMDELPDEELIEAYIEAKELGLDPAFILILEEEMQRRSLLTGVIGLRLYQT